jgi:hypothetical protein
MAWKFEDNKKGRRRGGKEGAEKRGGEGKHESNYINVTGSTRKANFKESEGEE